MLRRRLAALSVVAAVAAATALGWGLPHRPVTGAFDATSPSAAGHAVRAVDAVLDAAVTGAVPVVEAITSRGDGHAGGSHARDVLGATAVSVALSLLVAHRRRLSFGRDQGLRATVAAHGGRAPPV